MKDIWERYFALELHWFECSKVLHLELDKGSESNWGGKLEFSEPYSNNICDRGIIYQTGGEGSPEATLENLLSSFQEDYPVHDKDLKTALARNNERIKSAGVWS
jgi:hypothetical protein